MKLFYHPHVLKIVDVLEDRKNVYLILEYCVHGDFLGYINKKRNKEKGFKDRKILRFFQQMISGIEYIHAHNICHLDLKPENMLLCSNYQLKIADFGLSMGYQWNLKEFAGTINYSSPEVLSYQSFDGKMADMWSIGASLYVLSVGCLPYEDEFDRSKEILRQMKSKFPYLPSYLSTGCQNMLKSLLKVNPSKRISIEQIKLSPWFNSSSPPRSCKIFSPDLNLRIFGECIKKDLVSEFFHNVQNLGVEKNDLSCFYAIYSKFKTIMRVYYYQFVWCSLARKKDLHRHRLKINQKIQIKKKLKKYLTKKKEKKIIKTIYRKTVLFEKEKLKKGKGDLFQKLIEQNKKSATNENLWKFLSRKKKEIKKQRDLFHFQKNKNKKEKMEKIHEKRLSKMEKKIKKGENTLRSELIKLRKIDKKIDFRKLKKKINKKIEKKKKLSSRHLGKILKIERGKEFAGWNLKLKKKKKKEIFKIF